MSAQAQEKKRVFYDNNSKDKVVISADAAGHTPIPVDGLISRVSFYEPLFEKLYNVHKSLDHFYRSAELESSNLKYAAKNEVNNGKQYIHDRFVVGNEFEIKEKLVPSVFYSLISFYSGRIITNPHNWTSVLSGTKSTLGKISTSLPSRMLLPVALGTYTFRVQTPKTFERVGECAMEDVLHRDTVDFIGMAKKQIESTSLALDKLDQLVDWHLQYSIHQIRKFCVENWPL